MDAPVVVNPDTDSNKASVNEGIEPEKMYGRAPNIENKIHDKETIKPPSFFVRFSSGFILPGSSIKTPAVRKTIQAVSNNGNRLSEKITATIALKTKANARINKLLATILRFRKR
jgi:hypothetical protein